MDVYGPADCLPGGYDWHVVVLSIVIASVAAYVALALSERVSARSGRARGWWLLGGATAMGGGVWSMHFTGMLAFHLPVAVYYDVPLVALSFVAAVAASAIALLVASRPELRMRQWIGGGIAMGFGIATMHYVGMAAMRMPARAEWDLRVVALSVLVAIAVSMVALRIVYSLSPVAKLFAWRRVIAAIAMGFAIAGMHYTGMAAARFFPAPAPTDTAVVGFAAIGIGAIAFFSLSVMAVALITTRIDRHFSEQRGALAESRRQLRMLVGNAPVILIAIGPDGVVRMAEGRDIAALGHVAPAMLGRSFFDLYADATTLLQQARRALAGEEHTAQANVRDVVLETRWMPVRDASGAVESVIAVATDITERHRAESALKHQALHDALTDLPNRTLLDERLQSSSRRRRRAAGRSRWPWSIWIASKKSTTRSDTMPATRCCKRSPNASAACCAMRTSSRVSAETSSPSCCTTPTPNRSGRSSSGSSPCWRSRAVLADRVLHRRSESRRRALSRRTDTTPRRCCAGPTSRCTSAKRGRGGAMHLRRPHKISHAERRVSRSRRTCAKRSTRARSCSTISRSSTSAAAPSYPSRRWCAGRIPSSACCRPTSSSRSPSRPARSSRSRCG